MTALEELSRIKQRRLREDKLAIFLVIVLYVFLVAGSVMNDYFYFLIVILVYSSIGGGLSLWLGYFRTLRCPHCLEKLEYRKDRNETSSALFYCKNCGYLELPPPSPQYTKQVFPTSSYEKEEIIGICIVCNLPITEFEEQLICPFCFSLAHETHLLEWVKIKGYCPHCNAPLNNNLKKIYHD